MGDDGRWWSSLKSSVTRMGKENRRGGAVTDGERSGVGPGVEMG
jgi:hypothetical protein